MALILYKAHEKGSPKHPGAGYPLEMFVTAVEFVNSRCMHTVECVYEQNYKRHM